MEAVVLAAVLGFSVLTAVVAAFGTLKLAMYSIDLASGPPRRVSSPSSPRASDPWRTEVSLHDRPAPAPRLAA